MRSAGCVYNDIVDRKIDAKVSRTKSRPIAKGTISVTTGWMIILLLIFCFNTYIVSIQSKLYHFWIKFRFASDCYIHS